MDPVVIHRAANQRRLANEIVAVPGVTVPDPTNPVSPNAQKLLLTYSVNDADGTISLFPLEGLTQAVYDAVVAVVNAHDGTPDPPVVTFSDEVVVQAQKRTTDATPTELFRYTLRQQTGYMVEARLIGADAGNGAMRARVMRGLIKRLNAGALIVGTLQADAPIPDTAATAWAEAATVNGNDFVVTVTGAAGRNIDWNLQLKVVRFAPGGGLS